MEWVPITLYLHNLLLTWAISCEMADLMALVAFPCALSGFSGFSGFSCLTRSSLFPLIIALPGEVTFFATVVALGSSFLYMMDVVTFYTITSHMSVASTVEALGIWALVVIVVLSRRSGVFLFGLSAFPRDVAWFSAVVAGIGGCMSEWIHCGQLRAMCPSPPHLKQLACLSVMLVLGKNNSN